jgi:TRAP-type C4-dicarboxylate transport system permease small subunit
MGKLPRISSQVSLISERAVRYALAGIVAVMTVIIIAQVFLRYLFLYSLSWSEEVARYLMIWASFLGASLAVKYGLHIGVEYVINLFPQGPKRAIALVAKTSVLFFLVLFTIGGLQVAWALRDQDSPALLFSMFYAYLSAPVGGVFMMIQLWNSIVEDWAK